MESELIIKQCNPQPRLGIFGLLRESFKTIKRNGKLMHPLLLLVFIFFSQLEFAQIYLLEPVANDLNSQLAKHPKLLEDFGNNMHGADYRGALNDIREVLLVKLFIFILSSIISLVFLVATVSSSSQAYTSKVQNFTEMIKKIKKSWKKPILTSFYMLLVTIGCIFVSMFSIGVVSIFAVDSWAYMFYGVVLLSLIVIWIYVTALWMMSLVVSVLEDAGGLDAILRGRELMKGEKVKASLVLVVVCVAYGLVHLMTDIVISQTTTEKWSRLVSSIVSSNLMMCAFKLFVFVVFTIFYHEQKEAYDEKEGKSLYLPIGGGEV